MGEGGGKQGEQDCRNKNNKNKSILTSALSILTGHYVLYFLSSISLNLVPLNKCRPLFPHFLIFPSSNPLSTFLPMFLKNQLGHVGPLFKNPSTIFHRGYNKSQILQQGYKVCYNSTSSFISWFSLQLLCSSYRTMGDCMLQILSSEPLHMLFHSAKNNTHLANLMLPLL